MGKGYFNGPENTGAAISPKNASINGQGLTAPTLQNYSSQASLFPRVNNGAKIIDRLESNGSSLFKKPESNFPLQNSNVASKGQLSSF